MLLGTANSRGLMAKIPTLQWRLSGYSRAIGALWRVGHSLFWVLLTIPFAISTSTADQRLMANPHWHMVMAGNGVSRVPFETIAKGYRSGVLGSLQTAARNPADWTALWKKHASTDSNFPPLPAIDFTKEIAVAVFLGEKPTGGHDIEITSVERSGDNLVVSFVERSPQPGGVVTQAFTQPFHIVRVAAQSSGTVNFRRLS